MADKGKKTLDQKVMLKTLELKNRISCSPVESCVLTEADGIIRDVSVDYYRAVAKGGAGLIFQGATAVCEYNRMDSHQAGIWSDEQIPGLKRIADAVHEEGGKIIIQLQHAGIRSDAERPLCPSEFVLKDKLGREMTTEEVHTAEQQFISAARRAVEAGYDGVEIHAAHGWLVDEFLNSRVNKRTDEYGKDRLLFARNIYEGIRAVVPKDFIVGFRMSGFEPTIEDGIRHAEAFQSWGVDFLDISSNLWIWKQNMDAFKEEGFPYNEIIYSASVIRKHVSIPLLAASGAVDRESAQGRLELADLDLIQVGRGMMIDTDFANKVLRGEKPGGCLYCKTGCKFTLDQNTCPGLLLLKRGQAVK